MKKIYILILLLSVMIGFDSSAQVIEWQNTIGGTNLDILYSVIPTADGGYVCGGHSQSNISGDKTENCLGGSDYWIIKLDNTGNIQWQNTIGGTGSDVMISTVPTFDGGYICGGYSNSNISGDKTENSIGSNDYWIVKLDASGNIQWQNTIGGNNDEYFSSISQTSDGGYICGGYSNSNISGDKTENSWGSEDYWIIKLNSAGNIQWQNTIGGSASDKLYSISQTADGGYICGGESNSNISGDKTENSFFGNLDYWVVKLDATGNIQWQNTMGGGAGDRLRSVSQTLDGGYICGGYSYSNPYFGADKTEYCLGGADYWVIKLDATGNIQWQNAIGGDSSDFMGLVLPTADGGYLCGGFSASNIFGDKTDANLGGTDYWIVKLDNSGNIEWQKTIGGNLDDLLYSITQTTNGEYICGGPSLSSISGDKTENSLGSYDFWVVKLTGSYNSITGSLFADINSNNTQDLGEADISFHRVAEISSGRFTFSLSDGSYNLAVIDTGNFIASPDSLTYYNPVPYQHTSNFPAFNLIDSLNDFAFQPAVGVNDLCVSITPPAAFRPGFSSTYNIHYSNEGSTVLLPVLIFRKNSFLLYGSSTVAPASITADSVVWNLPSLLPWQHGTIQLTLTVSLTTSIGTPITCYARIEPIIGDVNPACNLGGWEPPLVVTGSYDPNEIHVSRPSIIMTELSSPPFLDYVIYFQNTGNDTAFTVKITNQLPASLDASSMELEALSHPADIQYNPGTHNLEIRFSNILLPDSTTDEPGSHGFIHYRIKPLSSLNAGDTIKSNARIYFDYNAPVLTNTAQTRIVTPVSSSVISINVTCFGAGDGAASVNPSGGTPPYTYQWSPVSSTFPTTFNLSPGIYTVTVTDSDGYTSTASVNLTEPPALTLATNQTIIDCAGNNNGSANATTGGGTPGYTYSWNTVPVQTTATANNLSAGTYIVTITDANGCTMTASQIIVEYPLPTASINPSGPTTFCQGNSVTLTSNAASGYLWSDNSTTQSINVNASGNYVVTVTDANNCSSVSPATTVTVNPNPPVPSITQSGDSLTSDLASGYQWYFNSVLIPGATSQSYHPLQNGNYSVVITDANNCTASSIDYLWVLTETGNFINDDSVIIYPNPARSELVIRSSEFGDNTEITIYNLLGENLFSQKIKAKSQQHIINVSVLREGIYFLEVRNEQRVLRMKFMKM